MDSREWRGPGFSRRGNKGEPGLEQEPIADPHVSFWVDALVSLGAFAFREPVSVEMSDFRRAIIKAMRMEIYPCRKKLNTAYIQAVAILKTTPTAWSDKNNTERERFRSYPIYTYTQTYPRYRRANKERAAAVYLVGQGG